MQIPASTLREDQNYPNFPEFRQRGIPMDRIDARLVQALQCWRDLHGLPLSITPVLAGIIREDGSKTSQHYAVGRLSSAIDIFPRAGEVGQAFINALSIDAFRGVGLYLDTKPSAMIHVDVRDGERILWVRTGHDRYTYFHKEPQRYLALLKEGLVR